MDDVGLANATHCPSLSPRRSASLQPDSRPDIRFGLPSDVSLQLANTVGVQVVHEDEQPVCRASPSWASGCSDPSEPACPQVRGGVIPPVPAKPAEAPPAPIGPRID